MRGTKFRLLVGTLSLLWANTLFAGSGSYFPGSGGSGFVDDDHILWGSGPDQVSLDDVPDGVTVRLGQDASPTGTPTFDSVNLTNGLGITSGGTSAVTAAGARASLGVAARGANADITSLTGLTAINDGDGHELLKFQPTNSAVNEISILNSIAGYGPQIWATGDDSDIPLTIMPKGSGRTIITNGGARSTVLLIGKDGSGARSSAIAMIGDDTYDAMEEGLKLVRSSGGSNANSYITNAGAGELRIKTLGAGSLFFGTDNADRLEIDNLGYINMPLVAITGGSISGVSLNAKLVRTAVSDVDYAALGSDSLIAYTAISAARVVSLPAAATAGNGASYTIKDESGSAGMVNTITIDPNGSETIDGAADAVINTAYGSVRIYSNGTNWFKF